MIRTVRSVRREAVQTIDSEPVVGVERIRLPPIRESISPVFGLSVPECVA